ncbi:autoinducer binding domain-containing protein [Mesorhizobium sp. M00.F.Ca.ET.217.01.1.1]|nr:MULTISPECIES: autoinducer binding domain-containing protein [unclassified Mesorhizobium]
MRQWRPLQPDSIFRSSPISVTRPPPARGRDCFKLSSWTSHYLQLRYHSHDPVILRGLQGWDTFDWGVDRPRRCLPASQQEILGKAAHFGIRGGLTMSLHDHRGRFAALTFASDQSRPPLLCSLTRYEKALQRSQSAFIHMPGAG